MKCESFQAMLPEHLDEGVEMTVEARTHASSCEECRRLLADLQTIRAGARELPPLAPARDLWSGISDRIAAPVVPMAGAVSPKTRRLVSLRVAGLAAAALIVATSAVTYSVTRRDESAPQVALAPATETPVKVVAQMPTEYDREVAGLRAVLDSGRQRLDPATVAILERNLTVIDSAIAQCQTALKKDPSSAFLIESLNSAYRTKVRLLRVAAQAAKG